MYPKKKRVKEELLVDVDELDLYDEETIARKEEEGELNPEEAGILRGNNLGNKYMEEEEEEAEE